MRLQLFSLLLSTRRRRAERAAARRWPETAPPLETALLCPRTAVRPQRLASATRNWRGGGARWRCLPPTVVHRVSTPGWVPAAWTHEMWGELAHYHFYILYIVYLWFYIQPGCGFEFSSFWFCTVLTTDRTLQQTVGELEHEAHFLPSRCLQVCYCP